MKSSAFGLLASLLITLQANALTQLDYIVAVVDDDVVLASELVSRIDIVKEQMAVQNAPLPPEQVLYSQMLERLIMESLQMQMGERAGVRIDDETLTQSLAGIAGQNRMTLEEFQAVLVADGMNYREFRDDVRREMIIQRVQRGRVNNRVHITEEEIDAFLDSPVGRDVLSDEFRVGHILLLVPDNVEPAEPRPKRYVGNWWRVQTFGRWQSPARPDRGRSKAVIWAGAKRVSCRACSRTW